MGKPVPVPTVAWRITANKKRALQAEAITRIRESLGNGGSSLPRAVASIADAGQIVAAIQGGHVTAGQVIKAYIARAIKAHEKTNCLTEVAFESALERAAALDEHVAQHGKVAGPLHGVPVTVKDQFNVKGLDTTLGYVGPCFKPATENAALVNMLESLGAVVIAKSNLPQSIMWSETENPLWGRTSSPWNAEYTPGGSTGGEAVLLASGASILGWGTDIGGSIRMPAHMMGLYGLKPSSARLPYRGVPVSTDGQEHVPSAVGPLARSLDTIHLAMKLAVQAEPWTLDPRCVPIPWRDDMYAEALSRPLTIGVVLDDGIVQPHPPVARVLNEAVERLRGAGHEIVPWDAGLHEECIQVMDEYFVVDGGQDIRDAIAEGGEPYIARVAQLLSASAPLSVYEYWQLNKRKTGLQQAYLDRWNAAASPETGRRVDALLTPTMPHTSVPHGTCRWVGYTKVWNLLDYPALVVPGGNVCAADVQTLSMGGEGGGARNEMDEWNRGLWERHGAEMAEMGLPVGLQLVGRKLEEEKLLAVGRVLDGLLKSGDGR